MKKYLYLSLFCVFLFGLSLRSEAQIPIITTIAGNGSPSYSGDNSPAITGSVHNPTTVAVDASGDVYIADWANQRVRMVNAAGIITTIAGTGFAGGGGDGTPATAAQLSQPNGVIKDAAGNIYIAEMNGNRVRKINTAGIISTIVGGGFTGDGTPASSASINKPTNLAIDTSGNLYIAEWGNARVRVVNHATGIISTVAGNGSGTYNGDNKPATAASLNGPWGIALDTLGNLFIADEFNNRVRKVVLATDTITTIAGTGASGDSGDGFPATDAQISLPDGITFFRGAVYYTNSTNNTIRRIDLTSGIITTVAGSVTGFGGDGGAATNARFSTISGVEFDSQGNMYLADFGNNRIRRVAPNRPPRFIHGHSQTINVEENYIDYPVNSQLAAIDSDNDQLITWSLITLPAHGILLFAYSATSAGIPITPTNLLYTPTTGYSGRDSFIAQVTDFVGAVDTIKIYVNVIAPSSTLPPIITTIAGTGVSGYTGDNGPATSAQIGNTAGVVFDPSGNEYISDFINNVIRKVSPSGIITTYAGNGTPGLLGDDGPATAAQLSAPVNLALDAAGNLYVGSANSNRVRKISASGIITTFAGITLGGYSGDNGPATAAQFNFPTGVAVDSIGNVYIAEYHNDRIRKVDTFGIVITVVGTGLPGGNTGDGGPATAAKLNGPYGVSLDRAGNMYIGDANNNKIRIVSNGIISTFAGNGFPGVIGDGSPATVAELHNPTGVVVDIFGNVFIADQLNNKIRKVSPSGIITTVAGSGTLGFSGDGCAATAAYLNLNNTLTLDNSGSLCICDNGNSCIRKLIPDHAPTFTAGHNQTMVVCENTVADSINSLLSAIDSDRGGGETWLMATPPVHGTVIGSYFTTYPDNASTVPLTPHSIFYAPTIGYSGLDSFKIKVTDCVGVSDTTTIVVNVHPLAAAGTITGFSAVCAMATDTLSDVDTGGRWSSAVIGIATVGSTGVVTGILAGTDTIFYTVTNDCSTDIAKAALTVNPLPAITLASAAPLALCAGDTLNLTSNASGGSGTYVAFNWSGPGGFFATAQDTTNDGIPVAGAGVYSVTVTDDKGCTSARDTTAPVTVHPLPVITATAIPSPVCVTTTLTLNATPTSGSGTYTTFTWSGPGLFTATTQNTSISNIGFGAAGVYSVTVTDNNGCTSAVPGTTDPLIVNPLPPAITGITAVCAGSSTALSDDPGGTWSSSNVTFATVDFSSGVVTGITSIGVPNITYTSVLGCIATTQVTINQTPPPITGASSVCLGLITTLSDMPGTGTWSSSDTTISAIIPGGPGIGIVTGISTGFSSVTYTLPNGCMASGNMIVNPLPQPIDGTTNACLGAIMSLSDPDFGGVWSISNPFRATVDPGSGTVTGITAGTATITYTLPTGCINTTSIVFQAVPGPIIGTTQFCQGAGATLHETPSGGEWSVSDPSIATVTPGASGTGIVTGVGAGISVVTYSLSTGCSSIAILTINPLPVSPAPLFGTSTTCLGSPVTFSDVVPGGTWRSSNSTVATILSSGLVVGLAGGTTVISYTETNSCGSLSATSTLTVIPPPPAPAPITGSSTVCQGSSILLADVSSGGGWTSGSTSVATVNPLGFVTGAAGGVVTVFYTETNTCGSTHVSKTVTVNPLPTIAGITGVTVLCAGTTTTLNDSIAGGTWVSSSLATATVATSGLVRGLDGGTSTITYTVTNGCGVAQVVTVVTVNPLPPVPALITGTSSLCTGSNTTLVETTAGGVWSSSDTLVASIIPIGVLSGISVGTAVITYTETTVCGVTQAYKTVSVNTAPETADISGVPFVCPGATTQFSDLTTGGTWAISNDLVAVIGDTGLVKGMNIGTATISYTVANSCGSSFKTTIVTVNPLPEAGLIAGKARLCPGDTIMLTDNITGGTWSSSNNSGHISGTGVLTGASEGLDTIIYRVTNSCGTANTTFLVNVLSVNICNAGTNMVTNAGLTTLKVYPNPNNGSFSVLMSSDDNEPMRLIITNIVGQKVGEYSAATNTPFDIKLDNAAGIYFVSAITGHGRYVAKIEISKTGQ